MARAKRASDEAYNVRRRAMRAAQRLEKQGKISEAQNLRRQAEQTRMSFYKSKKEYRAKRDIAVAETMLRRAELSKGAKQSRQMRQQIERSNTTFLNEMESMRKGQANALTQTSGLTPELAQLKGQLLENVFYRATRNVWYDSTDPSSAKYALENFMIAKGFESFNDAWEFVMNSQSDVMQKIDNILADMAAGRMETKSIWELLHNPDGTPTDIYEELASLITDFM